MQIETRTDWRLALLGSIGILGLSIVSFAILAVRRAADREYVAYEKLCALGATGDDWISLLELVSGRPPIVQIDIPGDVPMDTAFSLLPNLHNLEALTIAYDSLSDRQLDVIRDLKLNSLRFDGDFPSSSDLNRLSRFREVQFVSMPSENLSAEARQQLRAMLPASKIDFH